MKRPIIFLNNGHAHQLIYSVNFDNYIIWYYDIILSTILYFRSAELFHNNLANSVAYIMNENLSYACATDHCHGLNWIENMLKFMQKHLLNIYTPADNCNMHKLKQKYKTTSCKGSNKK
jgi:hypothetical protein